ncbi:hypothetical protein Pvag_2130 [Pantoea vagans C9-1]|nr:hypothetical protein Pvag_2130 [Pantoea vagans C9-1]
MPASVAAGFGGINLNPWAVNITAFCFYVIVWSKPTCLTAGILRYWAQQAQ